LNEFEKYWRDRSRFYQKIYKAILDTKQKYHVISYNDVLDVKKVNTMAKSLGSGEKKSKLEVDLIRQNPGKLQDKVINYHDVMKCVADMNNKDKFVLETLSS
jgi:hypothetical protein